MQILETTAQSYEIEKIIDESEDYTIIVSPYLKIHSRLKSKIADCYSRNNYNLILYREDDLTKAEKMWIHQQNVILLPIKNLHAKCYVNEKTSLVTSMNLYDYSQINNHEIGIKLTVDNNKPETKQLLRFIHRIIKTDYPHFDFPIKYDSLSIEYEYTMGGLFKELVNEYNFSTKLPGTDGTYRYICQIVSKSHKFSRDDYKFDGYGIKRLTPLDPQTYERLKKEILKPG